MTISEWTKRMKRSKRARRKIEVRINEYYWQNRTLIGCPDLSEEAAIQRESEMKKSPGDIIPYPSYN